MKRYLTVDPQQKKKVLKPHEIESRFAVCPICSQSIAFFRINSHIDSNCDGGAVKNNEIKASSNSTARTNLLFQSHSVLNKTSSNLPPGLFVLECFINEREEQALLEFLDQKESSNRWKLGFFNGPSFGKQWGVRTNLKSRTFLPPLHEFPQELMDIVCRIRALTQPNMSNFFPNEANAISYEKSKGHYLGAHCDDRQLSGKMIVNLSLAGDAIMSYTRDRRTQRNDENYNVLLKRRSLQIQTGISRYDYQHGIPNIQFISERRVSVTFRQNSSFTEKHELGNTDNFFFKKRFVSSEGGGGSPK